MLVTWRDWRVSIAAVGLQLVVRTVICGCFAFGCRGLDYNTMSGVNTMWNGSGKVERRESRACRRCGRHDDHSRERPRQHVKSTRDWCALGIQEQARSWLGSRLPQSQPQPPHPPSRDFTTATCERCTTTPPRSEHTYSPIVRIALLFYFSSSPSRIFGGRLVPAALHLL